MTIEKRSLTTSIDGKETRPCCGCGYCCLTALCPLAQRLHPEAGPVCPELLWSGTRGRYLCGLVALPEPTGLKVRRDLAIGAGCCSPLNTWRRGVRDRRHDILEGERGQI